MAVSRKQTAKLANWGLNLVLILIALLIMAPFWWVLVTSFLAYKEALHFRPDGSRPASRSRITARSLTSFHSAAWRSIV